MEDILTSPMTFSIVFLALLGMGSGFLAGLLGIGGGALMVPGLFYILHFQGAAPERLMHMAVGTSLAVIILTGMSSARAHFSRGAVDSKIVKQLGPGTITGTILGLVLAALLGGDALRIVFSMVLIVMAFVMTSNPERFKIWDAIPAQPWPTIAGSIIGCISALGGIGGAALSVPFMSLSSVPIHRAIGTASALGLLISIPAAAGFIISGLDMTGRPPFSLGYISVPSFLILALASVPCAPIGARLAHRLPINILRTVFAAFLAILSIKMALVD